MPRIADFDGLYVEALDQLGIDGFDASSEPLRPVGGDKGLSRLGGLHIAFEGGQQVDVVLLEFLLSIQR